MIFYIFRFAYRIITIIQSRIYLYCILLSKKKVIIYVRHLIKCDAIGMNRTLSNTVDCLFNAPLLINETPPSEFKFFYYRSFMYFILINAQFLINAHLRTHFLLTPGR